MASAALLGCADRSFDDLDAIDGGSTTAGLETDGAETTDGASADGSHSSGADSTGPIDPADASSDDGDASSGDPIDDPCAPFLDEPDHYDPMQPCGLTQVRFDWRSSALDMRAQCQLAAAASCIATEPGTLYLSAHASVDETDSEEAAIELSEDRGVEVRGQLVELGVSAFDVHVIAKGSLASSTPDTPEDRRVRLLW